jgi:hypothetical protein
MCKGDTVYSTSIGLYPKLFCDQSGFCFIRPDTALFMIADKAIVAFPQCTLKAHLHPMSVNKKMYQWRLHWKTVAGVSITVLYKKESWVS